MSGLQVCLGDIDTDSSVNHLLSEAGSTFWDFSYQVTLFKSSEVLDGWSSELYDMQAGRDTALMPRSLFPGMPEQGRILSQL